MSAQHTPGPWKTNGDPYVSTGDGKHSIAFTDCRGISDAEAKANARLIAAAPDLLEALKDCRRALEVSGHTGELAIVDAAIAKVEGGAA